MNLAGAGVIVTGGTGALGSAVVAELVARGARVAVPYRDGAAFETLRARVGGGNVWGAAADISSDEAALGFVEAAAAAWLARLDGLACIAGGYAGSGPLEAAPAAEWTSMMSVNLATVYTMVRACLPRLLARGGRIVTVGSALVDAGGAGAAAYAVSKAGVHALTRALAAENRGRGVRVNAVVPSTIDTPANRASMPGADPARWTPPAEIARVVAYLLSEESAPITGALVPVPGR